MIKLQLLIPDQFLKNLQKTVKAKSHCSQHDIDTPFNLCIIFFQLIFIDRFENKHSINLLWHNC